MLENCRVNKGEKKDDEALARKMAALCDVYVNDAFGTAHRAEATTHGIARFAKVACAGPLMAAELDALGKALANPKRPLVAIVAGSKVSTKLTILGALAEKVDQLIVGGGIANTFLLAAGKPIGKSLAEPDLVGEAKTHHDRRREVPLPDRRGGRAKSLATRKRQRQAAWTTVAADEMILDIGPDSAARRWRRCSKKAGTIVWNGPVGVFEIEPFAKGTETLAQGDRRLQGVLHRRRRRHGRRDRQVRHRQAHRLHLHRRRRVPGVPRRQEAARRGRARSPRGWLSSSAIETPGQGLHEITSQVGSLVRKAKSRKGCARCSCATPRPASSSRRTPIPTAKRDLERWLNRLVPEGDPFYSHDAEGPDDMPSHIKAALTATSLSIPDCRRETGARTWQGIYLWEHRRRGSRRELVVHIGA